MKTECRRELLLFRRDLSGSRRSSDDVQKRISCGKRCYLRLHALLFGKCFAVFGWLSCWRKISRPRFRCVDFLLPADCFWERPACFYCFQASNITSLQKKCCRDALMSFNSATWFIKRSLAIVIIISKQYPFSPALILCNHD